MEITEDGEQCQGCLRFTYDGHQDLCLNCGWQLRPEIDDDDCGCGLGAARCRALEDGEILSSEDW